MNQTKAKPPRKKRAYVLVEAVLSISLIALCIFPLATYPIKIKLKEISIFQDMELERMKEVLFKDLLLDLKNHLDEKLNISQPIEPKPFQIKIGDESFDYVANWYIKIKKASEETNTGLLKAYLNIQKKSEKLSKKKKSHKNDTLFEYLIEKKETASQREEYGSN
jgi:hypothetical protein